MNTVELSRTSYLMQMLMWNLIVTVNINHVRVLLISVKDFASKMFTLTFQTRYKLYI